uniref:HCO3_cotransp domain-containing protein n=1 Tax=Ascaris lumbricoides TaxID=6252 RepID=A0A0M3IRZ4_ASCLU
MTPSEKGEGRWAEFSECLADYTGVLESRHLTAAEGWKMSISVTRLFTPFMLLCFIASTADSFVAIGIFFEKLQKTYSYVSTMKRSVKIANHLFRPAVPFIVKSSNICGGISFGGFCIGS